MSERALAIDIVRGWGLEFDGTGDPKEFVGRIEDAAANYGIRLDHIAGAMMFLLKGNALNWWHDNATQMADWITFKRQLNLHFVRDIPAGQHPYTRLLPRNRGNRRSPWDTSQQRGGSLTKRGNNKRLITSPEQVRTEQPQMKEPLLLTDSIRQQEDARDLHPEESREEDRGAPTPNPSEETVEIPQVIQEEARLKQAQRRPGQQVWFKRRVEGKVYRVKINRGGYLSISQLGPDQLSDDQTNQPTMNRPQLLADGVSRQQDDVIDSHDEKSCEDLPTDCTGQQEDNMELHSEGSSWEEDHEVANPSKGATVIPFVIQEEARWRQAQRRPGQQVWFKRSVEGKVYRVKINRGGYLSICQLQPDQQAPINGPQLLSETRGGETRSPDVMNLHPEESCEGEDHDLTNPSEETTEIPQVIQQEARWRQAQKRPGQEVFFEMNAEGKDYLVKISGSGDINISHLKPEQEMDDQTEQPPTTDGGTPEQEDIHLEESWEEDREDLTDLPPPSEEEATEIPLVIQEEAHWRQAHKRPGEQMCYKNSVDGKEYRIRISRSGNINICQLKPKQMTEQPPANEPKIPLVIQQEAHWRQTHKRPGVQVCYKRSVEGKEYRIKISRAGIVNICQLTPDQQLRDDQPEQQPSVNEPQIPLVIQQEARLRQANSRPGQQVCYKRTVEGIDYRVKINRGRYLSIDQMQNNVWIAIWKNSPIVVPETS